MIYMKEIVSFFLSPFLPSSYLPSLLPAFCPFLSSSLLFCLYFIFLVLIILLFLRKLLLTWCHKLNRFSPLFLPLPNSLSDTCICWGFSRTFLNKLQQLFLVKIYSSKMFCLACTFSQEKVNSNSRNYELRLPNCASIFSG